MICLLGSTGGGSRKAQSLLLLLVATLLCSSLVMKPAVATRQLAEGKGDGKAGWGGGGDDRHDDRYRYGGSGGIGDDSSPSYPPTPTPTPAGYPTPTPTPTPAGYSTPTPTPAGYPTPTPTPTPTSSSAPSGDGHKYYSPPAYDNKPKNGTYSPPMDKTGTYSPPMGGYQDEPVREAPYPCIDNKYDGRDINTFNAMHPGCCGRGKPWVGKGRKSMHMYGGDDAGEQYKPYAPGYCPSAYAYAMLSGLNQVPDPVITSAYGSAYLKLYGSMPMKYKQYKQYNGSGEDDQYNNNHGYDCKCAKQGGDADDNDDDDGYMMMDCPFGDDDGAKDDDGHMDDDCKKWYKDCEKEAKQYDDDCRKGYDDCKKDGKKMQNECMEEFMVCEKEGQKKHDDCKKTYNETCNGNYKSNTTQKWQPHRYMKAVLYVQLANIYEYNMIHIHNGGSEENGPIAVWVVGVNRLPLDPPHTIQGKSYVSISFGPEHLEGEAFDSQGDNMTAKWDVFVKMLAEGKLYVNAHTLANPAGEIRGQLYIPQYYNPHKQYKPYAMKPKSAEVYFDGLYKDEVYKTAEYYASERYSQYYTQQYYSSGNATQMHEEYMHMRDKQWMHFQGVCDGRMM